MNIFVAGLSYQITDADLKELFEEYGEVSSAKIIADRESRRSKGYGFVEMSNDEEGQHAIEELNDAEYDGRTLSVSVARPVPKVTIPAATTAVVTEIAKEATGTKKIR